MNPRERMLTTLRGRTADRIPLDLPGVAPASREELGAIPDPFRRKLAQRIFDETYYFVQVPSFINRYLVTPPQRIHTEAEDWSGGRRRVKGVIDTPKGDLTFERLVDPASKTTWEVKYPVESPQDIKKIASIPWERPPGLKPPDTKSLPEDFSRRGILRTGVSSPFVCVAGMMSYQWFLELTATEPELIRELTEVCLERTLDVLEVLFSTPEIEYLWMGGSEWVTPPMASTRTYDALVQEQERKVIEYVKARSQAVVHIHCHGHVRHALGRTIERGADYTEPVEPPPDGDITMAEAKRLAAGRLTLGGNIEARVLCNENEEAVEAAVRAAFEGGKERFVLRTSDGTPPQMTEREFRNYTRLIDLWDQLSAI